MNSSGCISQHTQIKPFNICTIYQEDDCPLNLWTLWFKDSSNTLAALLPHSRKASSPSKEHWDVEQLDTRVQKFRKGQIEFTRQGLSGFSLERRNFFVSSSSVSAPSLASLFPWYYCAWTHSALWTNTSWWWKKGKLKRLHARSQISIVQAAKHAAFPVSHYSLQPGLWVFSLDSTHISNRPQHLPPFSWSATLSSVFGIFAFTKSVCSFWELKVSNQRA